MTRLAATRGDGEDVATALQRPAAPQRTAHASGADPEGRAFSSVLTWQPQ
jgi:hypothetical protein